MTSHDPPNSPSALRGSETKVSVGLGVRVASGHVVDARGDAWGRQWSVTIEREHASRANVVSKGPWELARGRDGVG
jgi:hypothetical protein